MNSYFNKSLNICVWNINGVYKKVKNRRYCKLNDSNLASKLCKYDIIGLVETHCNVEDKLYLEGYASYQVFRAKDKVNEHRNFGGLAIFIRQNIKDGIRYLENTRSDYQWIMLKKEFFNINRNLFMCIMHVPPQNSTYTLRTDDNVLLNIEEDIKSFGENCDILLTGDINARTGVTLDYIECDDNKYLPLDDMYTEDVPQISRSSQDCDTINSRGKELLDLCIAGKLRILNGRLLGDSIGKYTCHKPAGSSVVDYDNV
jgi:exonuclease III